MIAMPKLKCLYCKDRFDKESMITRHSAGNFCTEEHVVAYAIESSRKLRKKADKKAIRDESKANATRKRDFYANDTKTRKREAKAACHKYIRLRDLGNDCICCGRPLGDLFDAGHFLESGNNPQIRYDEDNIHGQTKYCNQYQGGNSDDYEGRLRLKIGDERVDRLKSMKGGTLKRTAQDYKEIEDYYKAKIKDVEG